MDWYRQQRGEHTIDLADDNDLSKLRGDEVLDTYRESQIVNEQVLIDVKRAPKLHVGQFYETIIESADDFDLYATIIS